MTDEMIAMLAKNPSLRVVSRTSAMQYKGVRRPVREIASELGVGTVLEGSVSRSGNNVHMTVQLIFAPTDTHLWAESYDRNLDQAFSLPSEISQTIASRLNISSSATVARPINTEAHDAYLHGRFLWFSENSDACFPYFEKAIELQPDYAVAWSGISDYYAIRAIGGEVPSQSVAVQWETAARKAVELDDSLAEAHNTLAAWYLFHQWDLQRAQAESARAIALNPNFAEGYHLYSYSLMVIGRTDEALRVQKQGMDIDPFSRSWALGYAYFRAHRYDDAIRELSLRAAANPKYHGMHGLLAQAHHFAGRDREAVKEWELAAQLPSEQKLVDGIRNAYSQGDYHAVSEFLLSYRKAQLGTGYLGPFWLALDTGLAGHREETLRLLEEALRVRDPRLIFIRNEPALDFVHSDPRFQAIVQKMGLPATN